MAGSMIKWPWNMAHATPAKTPATLTGSVRGRMASIQLFISFSVAVGISREIGGGEYSVVGVGTVVGMLEDVHKSSRCIDHALQVEQPLHEMERQARPAVFESHQTHGE